MGMLLASCYSRIEIGCGRSFARRRLLALHYFPERIGTPRRLRVVLYISIYTTSTRVVMRRRQHSRRLTTCVRAAVKRSDQRRRLTYL